MATCSRVGRCPSLAPSKRVPAVWSKAPSRPRSEPGTDATPRPRRRTQAIEQIEQVRVSSTLSGTNAAGRQNRAGVSSTPTCRRSDALNDSAKFSPTAPARPATGADDGRRSACIRPTTICLGIGELGRQSEFVIAHWNHVVRVTGARRWPVTANRHPPARRPAIRPPAPRVRLNSAQCRGKVTHRPRSACAEPAHHSFSVNRNRSGWCPGRRRRTRARPPHRRRSFPSPV